MSKLTITEILSLAYATGTEKQKTCIPKVPAVKKLCALKDLNLDSVVTKAKKRKKRDVARKNMINIIEDFCLLCEGNDINETNYNDSNETTNQSNGQLDLFTTNYLEIYTSIKALGFDFESVEFPGFQILNV